MKRIIVIMLVYIIDLICFYIDVLNDNIDRVNFPTFEEVLGILDMVKIIIYVISQRENILTIWA